MHKSCKQCGFNKSYSEFNKHSTTKDRYRPECKSCQSNNRKRYYLSNKLYFNKQNQTWKKENLLKNRIINRQWYVNNLEHIKKTYRQWYYSNIDIKKMYSKQYYQNNKERIRKRNAMWKKNNPNKVRCYDIKRRSLQFQALGCFSDKEWCDLKLKYQNHCLCCGKKDKLTIDHIVPLSKGGDNCLDNIQPLCLSCNSKKHTKIIDYKNQRRL